MPFAAPFCAVPKDRCVLIFPTAISSLRSKPCMTPSFHQSGAPISQFDRERPEFSVLCTIPIQSMLILHFLKVNRGLLCPDMVTKAADQSAFRGSLGAGVRWRSRFRHTAPWERHIWRTILPQSDSSSLRQGEVFANFSAGKEAFGGGEGGKRGSHSAGSDMPL